MIDYIPIFIVFSLMFLNVPIAISLIVASLVYFAFITDTVPLTMIIQKLVSYNMSSSLLAVPLFMAVGTIMNYAGITKRLMVFCDCLVGHKIGGLGHVNVLLSTVNGGICGSSSADTAVQCKILVPEMTKRGYPKPFSAAVTVASGLIAPIIPPGTLLILYGVMTETSIAKMFVAGYVPGILMCITEMIIVAIIARRYQLKPSREKRAGFGETVHSFLDSIWAIIIIILLVIGIRMGLFTIAEGACLVIAISLIVGIFIYKETKFSQIPRIFLESFHSTSSIMLMIIAASLFGMYLSWARIPQNIAAYLMTITTNKYIFMIISMILLLVMGMFLEGAAMMMIMTPILFPIAQSFGIDVVHYGILMIVNASIGAMTPPFGALMYLACNLLDVSVPDFIKNALPFILGLIVLLVVMMFIPGTVTFLPNLVYG